jgi:hypothetical protein
MDKTLLWQKRSKKQESRGEVACMAHYSASRVNRLPWALLQLSA